MTARRAVLWVCCVSLWQAAGWESASAQPAVGRWKLAGDARDDSGQGNNGQNHGADLSAAGRRGERGGAAGFDGRGAFIEVPHAAALNFGRGEFSLALWVHTDETLDDDLGDLVAKYDPVRRTGFQLSLRCNAGVTSSQSNVRQLQFGIDSGAEPVWRDAGRPGKALLAYSLAVHDGALYAGTCEPGKDETGRVYRYAGGQTWIDCGTPDRSNAVSSLAAFNGRLYAGTAKYRVAGSALPESENTQLGGRVFRYAGDDRWIDCGQLPGVEAVGGLVVYRGKLYASSLYRPAGFFRYEGDQTWTSLATPGGKRVESLGVYNGFLWATGYDEGHVYRFDGETWSDLGPVGDNTQTYSFAIHQGRLCVGTWPSGKVHRLAGDDAWEDLGQLGGEKEVMGMLVHNGQLYAGTLPLAEVYRFDGIGRWTKTARLDETPDVKYRRAWSMAQYQGRLYCGTLPSGRVHALEAGTCVTYDKELPAGWRHIAAVRERDRLRLYVDGQPVAESAPFDPAAYNLANDAPLRIGAGAGDFFRGRISDLRLYNRALTAEEIAAAARSEQNSR